MRSRHSASASTASAVAISGSFSRCGSSLLLDLRNVWIAGQWEAFQQHRIERDRERLYPHRDLVAGEAFFALAP
jgi:hypothetical protein